MRVFVLDRVARGEKFWLTTLLSAEEGAVPCMIRQATKKAGTLVPDLFDEAEVSLARPKAGEDGPRFVREYAVVARRTGISSSYEGLVFASRFAAVLARNAFPPDAREAVFALCRGAVDAFAEKPRKDATYFKALWIFVRECGLPVREDWFERLAFDDKCLVSETLRTPAESLRVPAEELRRVAARMEHWLARENDFVLA